MKVDEELASCKSLPYNGIMLGRTYENENCSAARALEVVGERWSLLILRDALFRGLTRFSDFERSLGTAPNILAKRLEAFVVAGLLKHRQNEDQNEPYGYAPTEKGLDLKPVIMALTAWGDRWAAPHGPPVTFRHHVCGGRIDLLMHCSKCEVSAQATDVLAIPTKPTKRKQVLTNEQGIRRARATPGS
jgi:DNA-binding HxlR family transcriptional regulator